MISIGKSWHVKCKVLECISLTKLQQCPTKNKKVKKKYSGVLLINSKLTFLSINVLHADAYTVAKKKKK